MREVDRRSKYDRRVFLKGAATTVPAVAIATSTGLGVGDAWAEDATTLTRDELMTIVPDDILASSVFAEDREPEDDDDLPVLGAM